MRKFQAVDEQGQEVGHARANAVNPTMETGLLPVLLRRLQVDPACPRGARLRAALLAVVWILPGVWCTAHIVDHELDSDHSEAHWAMSLDDRICDPPHDHGHWHSHLESSAVVSSEGAKKLDASALPSCTNEFDAVGATFRWHILSAAGPLTQRDGFASGPRAPPIS